MLKFLTGIGLLLMCVATAVAEVTVSPYLPAPRRFTRVETIGVGEIPNGPASRGAAAPLLRSLNGSWKISGLESSTKPFPADADFARGYQNPEFDDSRWDTIAVPLNWYRKYPEKQNKRQPYVKGWYRTGFELAPAELRNRRVILKFDVIGCEAVVFLNGREVGRHLGEFTPFELDATDAARAGRNVLAIRVFSDQGTTGGIQKVKHVYGSQWALNNIRGGIWQNVALSLEPEIRIRKLLVTPRLAAGGIEVDYTVLNHTGRAVSAEFDAIVSPAVRKDAGRVVGTLAGKAVELKPGSNTGTVTIALNDAVKWSIDNPYLHYLTLHIKESGKVVASRAVRFGYREFIAENGRFYLNGEPIYLFGQNINSIQYGGYGLSEEEEERKILSTLLNLRNLGYVIARTAHMPILPKVLEIADETGLMIFHEWGWCFTTNIDFEAFEKNNMREVAEFVESCYNHPSVTMWSMGNEVVHRNSPRVSRLMDLQVGLVRRLDKSKRPISTFSGAAGWASYGETRLDTDVHDLHTYTSLSNPWTRLVDVLAEQYEGELRIYGEKERLSRPLVAWENVGFSWGIRVDPDFRRGDVGQYAKYMANSTSWGDPRGVGFTGCAPLFKAVGPGFGEWAQTLYGRRIFELYRLDPNYSGFAPWFGGIRASTLWTQPVFPSLHNSNHLFPRNLFLGEESPWILEVINSGKDSFRNLKLQFALAKTDHEVQPIGSVDIAELAAQSRHSGRAMLRIPADLAPGNYQLRLTLTADGREIARNYYDLYLQSRSILTRKIDQRRPVFVLDTGAPGNLAALQEVLDNFKLKYSIVKSPGELKESGVLVVPAEHVEKQKISLPLSSDLARFLRHLGGTLLVLEQKNSRSVLPENQSPSAEGNTFVDLVTPGHPLFAGLDYTSFDTWNNPDHGFLVTGTFVPYTVNALAVKGPMLSRANVGNAVVEAVCGRGRIILSQLETMACHKVDSVAATWLYNLFHYAVGAETFWDKALPLADAAEEDYVAASSALMPIDLAPYANVSFQDEEENDGRGGWTDQGENDFRVMPLGEQSAAGIPFHIIDPEKNNGKSCLVVRGSKRPRFPAAIRGIKVGRRVSRIFFLHTAAWGDKGVAGAYRIVYADGKTTDYVVEAARNVGDWQSVAQLSDARMGIIRKNSRNQEIGTFVAAWDNPRPQVPVVSFDFLSADEARGDAINWLPTEAPVPVLVAATAEEASSHTANLTEEHFVNVTGTKDLNTRVKGEVKRSVVDGQRVLTVRFPAVAAGDCPALMLTFKKEGLSDDYHYLSCWIRSREGGILQFILPEQTWHGSFRGEITVRGDGQWHKYRLMFGKDFQPTGSAALSTLRGELFLFHRTKRAPGAARPEMNFELKNIMLE